MPAAFRALCLRTSGFAGLVILLVVSMVVVACMPPAEEGELTGRIQIDGSSTVYPITEAMAEDFMREHPRVRITVGVSGTGGGFSRFGRGESDINNASRPISRGEIELTERNGIEFIEIPIAYDGLAVMVHPSNDFVDCLTVDELRRIWEPGSTINNWNEVRDEFPARPLRLYGRATDSGTYDYFTAAIMGQAGSSRTDFTASVDDNVIVQGVGGDPSSLGFFGLAYYENNRDRLKLVGVDDENPETGDGCVEPSAQTVQDGDYQPLSRPEFIYIRRDRADSEEIQEFIRFFLENADRIVREIEYVPLSPEAYVLAWERFDHRITGTIFREGDGSQIGVRMIDLLEQSRPADTEDEPGADLDLEMPAPES